MKISINLLLDRVIGGHQLRSEFTRGTWVSPAGSFHYVNSISDPSNANGWILWIPNAERREELLVSYIRGLARYLKPVRHFSARHPQDSRSRQQPTEHFHQNLGVRSNEQIAIIRKFEAHEITTIPTSRA